MLPFDPLPTLSKFGERLDRYVGYKLCSSPLGGYLEACNETTLPSTADGIARTPARRERAAADTPRARPAKLR